MAAALSTRPRDWFVILRDLTAAGISYAKVARKCNRNPHTVKNWADGGEPKESDARVVLALYARHCPDQYKKHQVAFEIHTEIEAITEPGEQRGLI